MKKRAIALFLTVILSLMVFNVSAVAAEGDTSGAPVLIGVPDITVDTEVGTLPHLPYYIPGEYQGGVEGPLVRVNWPAPTNNNQVLAVGTYTLTGTVPGTTFQPTATVNVKTRIQLAEDRVSALKSTIKDLDIVGGLKNALTVKLDQVLKLLKNVKEDKTSEAVDVLDGFIGQANDLLNGGVLTEEEAEKLIIAAQEIIVIPEIELEAFLLSDVTLDQDNNGNDTQFIKNRNKFVNGLVNTNPDRFLWVFRDAFGEPQPEGVTALGGWDTKTTKLRGHATGHYMSALAQAYASVTYDESIRANLKQKMDYIIDELYKMSQKSGKPAVEGGEYNADPKSVPFGPGRTSYDSDFTNIRTDYWNWGEGFISGYPPDQFIMLENGATYGSSSRQIWAPYYTLHKIIAGLLDCYQIGGNEKALTIAKGMGVWVYERLKDIPESTLISMWDRYIAGEYGGMNEVMAKLYDITGDERYLTTAMLFDNINVFYGNAERTHGLAMNVDTFRGKHANQQLPQITGALKTYDVSDDMKYYDIAANFWDIAKNSYMYSIGGVAGAKNPNNSECFTAQPNTLFTNGFNTGGQNETCGTYNLLKLTRQLFMHDQDGKYMDYYEQALYNDILASVAENNPGNTYHIPLNPGAQKSFGNGSMTGFSCCNGTGLESSTKLQDSIYFKSIDDNALYVNLYVPSTLTWTERNVVVSQETNYPKEDTTKLTINGAGNFDVNVRVPVWATEGFFVKINGEEQAVRAIPGTYLTLSRTWADGDTIELRMPFHFYLSKVMDKPNIASIFYGPVLLATEETRSMSNWRKVDLDAEDIGLSITGDPSTLHFSIINSANADYNNDGIINDADKANLKPFWEFYTRHSVYLDVNLLN